MNARTNAHLDHLAAVYAEHVRALHAHLGITATITPGDVLSADDILPGPPMDYALRARLDSGLVIDAYERVQRTTDQRAAAMWPDGLFVPRCGDQPGHWCVEVKRWVPMTVDSLADRNARDTTGLFSAPIYMRLERLCCLESHDRSPQGLAHAVIAGLKTAAAAA